MWFIREMTLLRCFLVHHTTAWHNPSAAMNANEDGQVKDSICHSTDAVANLYMHGDSSDAVCKNI